MPESLPPRILVVADDEDVQIAIESLLVVEGYEPRLASGLREALAALEAEPFDLILAEIYVDTRSNWLTSAQILRCRAHPAPVGLLTTQSHLLAEATSAGCAFVLQMPFDVEDLLTTVAATLARPWSPEQKHQAMVVRSFFAALQAQDWAAALAFCTDEVTYYPARPSPFTADRRLQGKAAYAAYLAQSTSVYTRVSFPELHLYPCPKGLAARFLYSWVAPDGTRRRRMGTFLAHFDGARIAQVGVRLPAIDTQSQSTPVAASDDQAPTAAQP